MEKKVKYAGKGACGISRGILEKRKHRGSGPPLSEREYLIFELVEFLMHDLERVHGLVLEARGQANRLAAPGVGAPYPFLAENVYNGAFDGHPAMRRYLNEYRF